MQLKRNRRAWVNELSLVEPFVIWACVLFVWPINYWIHFRPELLHSLHDSLDSQFFVQYPFHEASKSLLLPKDRSKKMRHDTRRTRRGGVKTFKHVFGKDDLPTTTTTATTTATTTHIQDNIFAYLNRLVNDSNHEQTCTQAQHSHRNLTDFHMKADDWLDTDSQSSLQEIESEHRDGEQKMPGQSTGPNHRASVRLSIPRRWLILTNAPVTKFWLSHTLYIVYLIVFSLAVLAPACGQARLDLMLIVWHFSIVLDNMQRSYHIYSQLISIHLTGLKYLELLFECLFLLVLYLGRILQIPMLASYQYYVRMCMCVALLKAYIQYVGMYTPIHPKLGPLYYYLKLMSLSDSLRYLALSAPVMISFGVAIQISMYPDAPIDTQNVLRILYRSVYSIFVSNDAELLPTLACERQRMSSQEWQQKASVCLTSEYRSANCSNGGVWSYLFVFTFLMLQRMVLNNTLSWFIFFFRFTNHLSLTISIDLLFLSFPPPFII